MEKLTIEVLAPYLPYGLKVSPLHIMTAKDGIGGINHILTTTNQLFKPRMRPLSELTNESLEFEYLGVVNLVPAFLVDNKPCGILAVPYYFLQELIEKHFDVFRLIDKGLAIDLNAGLLTNE